MADHQQTAAVTAGVVGNYRIERLLGRGGMGSVFLAYDTVLHRRVALKVLSGARGPDDDWASLLREARSAAALNHPNICTIHEIGTAGDTAFIAMEYVDGRSLRDWMDSRDLPVDRAIRYVAQAADALAYAHEQGVVHRDFKAANIIVGDRDQRVRIVDFGLARREDLMAAAMTTAASLVSPGSQVGTPYAMAPEQVRGERAGARADIWALGVLLYEIVGGAKPFDAATVPELFSSILRDPPRPLRGVSDDLRAVMARCLEKAPEQRFESAGEVRAALETILDGQRLRPGRPIRVTRRGLLRTAGAAAFGAAAVGAGFGLRAVRERLGGAGGATIRVAVLPFENLTGDPQQAYLSDGLTEEMISRLGRLHPSRLVVIARTSSARYKDRTVPIDRVGRELGVNYVLDGSARRENNRVRVSATLVDVRDQSQRWSGSFERELAGVLSLQSDIAFGIARSLALALLPAEQARLAGAPLVNPDAYESYLQGLARQSTLGPSNLDSAQQFFDRAVEQDRNYALAYTGLAAVWIGRQQTGAAARTDAAPRIKAFIARALELDDTLAEAHFRQAEQYAWTDWDWPAAGREFQRALDLNPSLVPARALYADYLAIEHRYDEALAQSRRAIELDPVNPQTLAFYARTLMFAHRLDESLVQYRAVLKLEPKQQVAIANLRILLHEAGRHDEALAADRAWAASAARGGQELVDALANGYDEGGYRGAMRRAADLQAARAAAGRLVAFNVAQFYMRAGEADLALDWLEKSRQAHEPGVPFIAVGSIWDPLRAHLRFRGILKSMNL